jgi:undecaprenyl-diphosphatase
LRTRPPARSAGRFGNRFADSSGFRVRFNAADLALYRRVRSLARTPDTVTWVRRHSRRGEHGAAYLISTSVKLAVGRKRPVIEDLPHLMATPTGLSFPSLHATSSFAAAPGTFLGSFGR